MFDMERNDTGQKINGFIDVNGVPYILGDYLNGREFLVLNPDQVKNEVTIDNSVPNRAFIQISLDQINRNADTGVLIPRGNIEKRSELDQMISNYREFIAQNYFGVVRKGVIVKINYRIETQSGRCVRNLYDYLKIFESGLYTHVSDFNVADPAVIANYSDSIVASINSYIHGTESLVLRINSINLFYEVITPKKACLPKYTHRFYPYGVPKPPTSVELFDKSIKNRNEFYHFGNNNRDIFINLPEVDCETKRVMMLPCGTFYINKTFPVVPMQRVIFNFSIWKNDLTIVPDTYQIANRLGIYAFDTFDSSEHHFVQSVVDDLREQHSNDRYRDQLIADLYMQIEELKKGHGPKPPCPVKDTYGKPVPIDNCAIKHTCSIPQFPINSSEPYGEHFKHVKCKECPPPPPQCDAIYHHQCGCNDDLFVEDIQQIVDQYMD